MNTHCILFNINSKREQNLNSTIAEPLKNTTVYQSKIALHLECFEKGLIYNEDDSAPTPKKTKVPMHLLYPGYRIPIEDLPRGVERVMVAEHFTKDDGSCKSACGTYFTYN